MAKATKTAVKKTAVKKTTSKKTAIKKVVAKKKAVKKTISKTEKSKEKKSLSIKYSDKSAGQPGMVAIFNQIKKMLEPYDKKRSLILHADKPSQAHLVSHKPVIIADRPRNELWFISAIIQKGYVGFYYMPVYMNDEMKKHFSEAFINSLKGKACFHIQKNTPEMMKDIKKAIELGYKAYIDRGWL